ncbi:MarR family winged helix-turn-helix transcriptional regulator [Streptomyces fuscigenes]|uniref:MarR family winged helix-turn-helix transcriptional regulator n=1 Tax=Streptomyces fuscigenes TaxID=1528880 RepID=UPI001F4749E5|nr:MarR family winged helix-turn-helix transcriptional regulator [Streptomyces fuscigenes]MCF3964431.1 MarR family winged helix-turn-helix transcriptional regulator [Streptomyces fuscigenes]
MATESRYVEVARHITALGAVKRALTRALPTECPGGPAAVLSLLSAHGEMRMSRLSELLAVDVSVTSRHVAHAAQRGWLERLPDPADGRSRLLRLTPAGEEMIAVLGERAVAMIARTLADWTDDELNALTEMLDRLRTDFGDCRVAHGDHSLVPPRRDAAAGRNAPADGPPGTAVGRLSPTPAPSHP